MTATKVTFCPKCKKPVEAKDFVRNSAVVAVLDSVLPTIYCQCGYTGLPIQLSFSDYKKLTGNK